MFCVCGLRKQVKDNTVSRRHTCCSSRNVGSPQKPTKHAKCTEFRCTLFERFFAVYDQSGFIFEKSDFFDFKRENKGLELK